MLVLELQMSNLVGEALLGAGRGSSRGRMASDALWLDSERPSPPACGSMGDPQLAHGSVLGPFQKKQDCEPFFSDQGRKSGCER